MSTPLATDDAFRLPVDVDVNDIRETLHARMGEQLPGWQPIPSSPTTAILGALATVSAEGRDALQARIRGELMDLIGFLFGSPRETGTPASSTVTFTAADALGHEIPAATSVWLGDVEMETVTDAAIPVGSTSISVAVQTVEPGAQANGADDTGVALETSTFDWLAETNPVALDAPLALGTDAETDGEYLARLADELAIMSPAPILPASFAVLARRHPAVGYAWCLPGYNASTNTPGVPLHVTLVVAGPAAEALPQQVLDSIRTGIAALLLSDVVLHVISPTYVPVSVTATLVCRPGWDPAAVAAAGEEHLAQVLSPAGHAAPSFGDAANPVPAVVIHENELIARGDEVDGVGYVEDLQIGDGSSDRVTLGVRQLPTAGAINVTALPA